MTAHCPARLTGPERTAVLELARRAGHVMNYADYARVDIRLRDDGVPFFIEMNPLPSLEPDVSHMIAARQLGLTQSDLLRLIIRSAARRNHLPLRPRRRAAVAEGDGGAARPTSRELGVRVGFYEPGPDNAITDVKGVKVGHLTFIEDDVAVAGLEGKTSVRTGLTAILPAGGDIYTRHMAAGGFILNGTGEMVGLSQVNEWGWLESPIMLCSTMSVGVVHKGVIDYMLERHPNLGAREQVLVPVIGETDDSFLNDVRVGRIMPRDVRRAIQAAKTGPVPQGSVGAGTGMTTFDFAGGIGSASRLLPRASGGHDTLGVLVLSNFGRMRNLTVSGAVVGRDLDRLLPSEGRRYRSGGSAIVIVATDAPMLSGQLSRLCKRAALGLGRVGTFAASGSGEFALAFSTGNRIHRDEHGDSHRTLRFVSGSRIDAFYEAVIEATEEAVLNAIFCSPGMSGREGMSCPPVPADEVLRLLSPGTA